MEDFSDFGDKRRICNGILIRKILKLKAKIGLRLTQMGVWGQIPQPLASFWMK